MLAILTEETIKHRLSVTPPYMRRTTWQEATWMPPQPGCQPSAGCATIFHFSTYLPVVDELPRDVIQGLPIAGSDALQLSLRPIQNLLSESPKCGIQQYRSFVRPTPLTALVCKNTYFATETETPVRTHPTHNKPEPLLAVNLHSPKDSVASTSSAS